MKLNLLYSLLFCGFLSVLSYSCKTSSAELQTDQITQTIDIALCPGDACCSNLVVANGEKIAGPGACSEQAALYAVNLEAFGLDQINDCDQTRTIEYTLLDDCYAVGAQYDCFIVCDLTHGLLIEIVKVMD